MNGNSLPQDRVQALHLIPRQDAESPALIRGIAARHIGVNFPKRRNTLKVKSVRGKRNAKQEPTVSKGGWAIPPSGGWSQVRYIPSAPHVRLRSVEELDGRSVRVSLRARAGVPSACAPQKAGRSAAKRFIRRF